MTLAFTICMKVYQIELESGRVEFIKASTSTQAVKALCESMRKRGRPVYIRVKRISMVKGF
jgi:hypothetical protein